MARTAKRDWLLTQEAIALTGYDRQKLLRLVARGDLPNSDYVKESRTWLYFKPELLRYKEREQQQKKQKEDLPC